MKRYLSLGAGVQSSTLLLLSEAGELEPLDAAIFADTGWEPRAVYRWLDHLDSITRTPIIRVSAGDLRSDAIGDDLRAVSIPAYVQGGILSRHCTSDYKVRPIRQAIRKQMGLSPRDKVREPVEQWVGISLDEIERMNDNGPAYLTIRWPLIERRMTRNDCRSWLAAHGYPVPPKSSCIGCPFHSDYYWRRLREESPEEWADAVAFDEAIREPSYGVKRERFLHRRLIPLAVAVSEQPTLFDDDGGGECGGACFT